MPQIRSVCPGCKKLKRFSPSFVERVTQRDRLCRPCFKREFGRPRPIIGRTRKERVNIKHKKAVTFVPKKESKKKKGR